VIFSEAIVYYYLVCWSKEVNIIFETIRYRQLTTGY